MVKLGEFIQYRLGGWTITRILDSSNEATLFAILAALDGDLVPANGAFTVTTVNPFDYVDSAPDGPIDVAITEAYRREGYPAFIVYEVKQLTPAELGEFMFLSPVEVFGDDIP